MPKIKISICARCGSKDCDGVEKVCVECGETFCTNQVHDSYLGYPPAIKPLHHLFVRGYGDMNHCGPLVDKAEALRICQPRKRRKTWYSRFSYHED